VTSDSGVLEHLEEVLDRSGVALSIEALLPKGGRPRQLCARTLLLGMLLSQRDHRPAHLTRVLDALVSLSHGDRKRLRVTTEWKAGEHVLTYRQVERTFSLVVCALKKHAPDGTPSGRLAEICDRMLEASIPDRYKSASSSLAVDWSDVESFSNPPLQKDAHRADKEASWGHRRGDSPGQRDEVFFGYFVQSATMVADESGPPVAELTRRMLLTTCRVDPVPAFVAVLERLRSSGVVTSDVLCDSGYAHRSAKNWALPVRRLGADLVMDLHPNDRGQQGTYKGAICFNGTLYCPSTPQALFGLGPLKRDATGAETEAHDLVCDELARYKLGHVSSADRDGYWRVVCPAVAGKLRCPLRESSMELSHARPEVLSPPRISPECCSKKTITVGPEVMAKTIQKHDYPGKAHRISYARRTGVERTFSTIKDPASNDISRGWCRLMGTTAITLFALVLFCVRNDRIICSFEARQADEIRRASTGLPPRRRRRRRRTLNDLVGSTPGTPL
jgi:Transposase DDE domain